MPYFNQGSVRLAIDNQKNNLKSTPNLLDLSSEIINLNSVIKEYIPNHRERYFSPTTTLNLFLHQVLNADKSCQNVVIHYVINESTQSARELSSNTSAYCKARQRLPGDLISHLTKKVGTHLHETARPIWHWQGRSVKIADATTVSMPDTLDNQKKFPQIAGQKAGLGFPIARCVAVISLASGAILDLNMGDYKTGEMALFRPLLSHISTGDILLADRLYCTYFLVASLMQRGIDCVFKLHAGRTFESKRGRWLGPNDHLIGWRKPLLRPKWLDKETYDQMPEVIKIRELKKGNTVLATTLLDRKDYPKNKIIFLYRERWQIELDFRSIKIAMQMDILRCKKPTMIIKEIWMHLLAYNLIRWMMVQAAYRYDKIPRKLSYKAALQTITSYSSLLMVISELNRHTLYKKILLIISQHKIGERPHRKEPRAIKRRPKPCTLLMEPRAIARKKLKNMSA